MALRLSLLATWFYPEPPRLSVCFQAKRGSCNSRCDRMHHASAPQQSSGALLPVIAEAGVAKAGTDGQHSPTFDILHGGRLA